MSNFYGSFFTLIFAVLLVGTNFYTRPAFFKMFLKSYLLTNFSFLLKKLKPRYFSALDSTDFCNDTVRQQWPWVRLDFYGLSFDFER